jgi:hypothetical protein
MRWLWMLASIIAVVTSLAASQARAQTCQQLWAERNQFYKNHGPAVPAPTPATPLHYLCPR